MATSLAAAEVPTAEIGSTAPPRPLPELRVLIDGVDTSIVRLLNERAKLVMEVGRRKAADGTPVYAPHREQAVLTRVLAANSGPLLPTTLEAVYREIMSGSFALERQLRVGFLGPPGSFSHEAAVKQFGKSVMYENLRTIGGVFEEVGRGHVDYGLVPVENASIGSVAETLEGLLLHADRVAICAEVHLSVTQALIAAPGAVPSDVKVIMSKPEALAQCRRWLATQYPHASLVPTASTSAAVAAVAAAAAEGRPEAAHTAAIASRLAAELHDLPVMFPEVNDQSPNVTRFLVLCSSRTASAVTAPSGRDKTSALFVCGDRPGALRDVLDGFASAGINLTHIEKRPCPPEVLARLQQAAAAASAASPAAAAPAELPVSAAVSPAAVSPASADALTAAFAIGSSAEVGAAPAAVPAPPAVPPGALVASATGGRGAAAGGFVYAFFIEADAHLSDPRVSGAIEAARRHSVALKVLGTFPQARRVL